ncbi:MAG TPA: alpha/beta hydrolase [Steroidobacteraceae bacterium]|nr:alpha/beta hydrolase [Steroidobacteraceae bacterium]
MSAEPMFFGPEGRPLFGWLYRPPPERALGAGLVICNPFGNEALCAHRTIRHLSARAASAGFAVLRFDYDGTGDSAGHSFEAERLTSWVTSVQSAADTLIEASGVGRLYFAGFRLGATIAALASVARSDVYGLIAIVPVVRGGAYVRELRLLQRAMDARRDVAPHEDAHFLESAGFALTAATQESLRQIDLTRLQQAPCQHVLIVDRGEMPIDLALVPALRELGSAVDHIAERGYTAMMLDPHESVVPEEILTAVLGWLENAERTATPAAISPEPSPPTSNPARRKVTLTPLAIADPATGAEPQVAVEETLVQFGGAAQLFGVLSAPAGGDAAPTAASAVVLLNAGAVHHVGPNRLYVALARHLARLGHTVLRMDLAGLGDSAPRAGEPDNVVHPHAALQDVRNGIDFLRRERGARDVRALGLCSGAYHAFKGAVARLPLDAAVIVNPLTFFWKDGMSLTYPQHRVATDIMRYRSNAFSIASWRKLLSGQVDLRQLSGVLWQHLLTLAAGPRHAAARALGRPLPDDLRTELEHAAAGGIGLQFVFSDGDPGFELLRQGGGRSVRRLRARDELTVNVIPGADHTFTDLEARTVLVDVLTRKIQAPVHGAASAPSRAVEPPLAAVTSAANAAVPAVVVGGSLNGLGVVRSLARGGMPIYVMDTARACAAGWSRHCTFVPAPALEGRGLIDALKELAGRLGERAVLILTSDESVATVAAHRAEIEPLYRISLPPANVIKVLTDKTLFQALAEREGLQVPRAVTLSASTDLAKLEKLTPPLVVKPAQKTPATSAVNGRAVRAPTVEAARAATASVLAIAPHAIVQEWVDGPDTEVYFALFTCDARGHIAGLFAGRKLVCDPPGIGSTAVCVAAPEVADELSRQTQHFAARVGYRGLGGLEFKRDTHTGRFLIIKPTVGRTDAQEELASLCGVNIPLITYEAELGRTPPSVNNSNAARIAWRASREFRKLPDCFHPATRIVDGYFRWGDPLPAVFHYGYERGSVPPRQGE